MKNNLTSKKPLFLFLAIIILFFILGIFLFFIFQWRSSLEQLSKCNNDLAVCQYDLKNSEVSADAVPSWQIPVEMETYQDEKLGYSIQYPKRLHLSAVDAKPKLASKAYEEACKTGKINGCGGSRYPDFQTDFKTPEGNVIFSVYVYQFPSKQYGLGDIVRDNFTYGVRLEDLSGIVSLVDRYHIQHVLSTMDFIVPEKPLNCLWSPELSPGLTRDQVIKLDNQTDYISGYYFDSNTNACKKTLFYDQTNPDNVTSPPFKDIKECELSCI